MKYVVTAVMRKELGLVHKITDILQIWLKALVTDILKNKSLIHRAC